MNEYLECLEGDVGSNPTRSTFLDTYNKNNMDNNKIRGIISKMIKEELQNEFFGKVTADSIISKLENFKNKAMGVQKDALDNFIEKVRNETDQNKLKDINNNLSSDLSTTIKSLAKYFSGRQAGGVASGAIFREENEEQIDEFYKLKVLAGIIK